MLKKQNCDDFELQLSCVLKEAEGTKFDRVRACYLGLRTAFADLYCDCDSDLYSRVSRVLDWYVKLRSALDDERQIIDDALNLLTHGAHEDEQVKLCFSRLLGALNDLPQYQVINPYDSETLDACQKEVFLDGVLDVFNKADACEDSVVKVCFSRPRCAVEDYCLA
jgi:hypothetical protein